VLRDALVDGVGATADDELRPAVRRLRPDAAGCAERLARPDARPLVQHLVHDPAAMVEVDAGGRVVVLPPADRDAEDEPAVRDHVDRRGLLGDERAVGAVRRDQDRRGEPDALGHRGCRGERDERFEVRIDDPVDRPEAGEAAGLRAPGPLEQLPALDSRDRRG
jgi:hypothetical protein